MRPNYTIFQIPSFAKNEAYNFDADENNFKYYDELNAIAEELEKCRLRNS